MILSINNGSLSLNLVFDIFTGPIAELILCAICFSLDKVKQVLMHKNGPPSVSIIAKTTLSK